MLKQLKAITSQERIAGGAMVLAVTGLLASVCGFLRDQAFSITFPLDKDPLGVASVYIAAFRPSDLLFQIFVMSCLSVVVVPFLAGHLAHGRKEEMSNLLSSTMIVFGLVFGLIGLVMFISFPFLAPHMVKFQGETLALYIRFGRIALLTNFLFVFGNALGQYLLTIQRYWVFGITPIVWAFGTIFGTYFLSPLIGPMGPITGTVIGTVIYVIWRTIAVVKSGFRFNFNHEKILHHELRQMGWLLIPRMAALGALQLQLLLLDRLASGLGNKMVALNQFASNFESVIPGIVGIAIAQSAFSLLSQSAALNNMPRLKEHLKKGMLINLALAIPATFALAVLSGFAAWLMHLSTSVSALFINALLIYCFAVPFESSNHIILRTFYALKNTSLPAISSAISCACAVISATLLLDTLNVYALAVAYVVGQVCQTLFLGSALFIHIRRKCSGANTENIAAAELF